MLFLNWMHLEIINIFKFLVTINRRAIEKKALMDDQVVETSTERNETFVVSPHFIEKRRLILEKKKEALMKAMSGEGETIQVEISEAVLEISGDCIPFEDGENISWNGTPNLSMIMEPKQPQLSDKAMPDFMSSDTKPFGFGNGSSDNLHTLETFQVEQTKMIIEKIHEKSTD